MCVSEEEKMLDDNKALVYDGAVLDLAASRGERECSAHLVHSLDGQTSDPGAEQFFGDEREIVERECALLGHSVIHVEDDLSRDLSDRSSRRHAE